MADFWSGFNQGFQPYGTRAADLISRTILNNAQYDREVKDKQKIEQEKVFQENLRKQQQEGYFQKFIQDPVGNADLLGIMERETASKAKDWMNLQPTTKRKERSDNEYDYYVEETTDWQGNLTGEKILQKNAKKVKTEEITKDGVTRKYNVLADGTKKETYLKIDYDKPTKEVEKAVEEERTRIDAFHKLISRANLARGKQGIFNTQSDIKASEYGLNGTPDYTKGNIAQLEYENILGDIRYSAKNNMSEEGYKIFQELDNDANREGAYAEDYKEILIEEMDNLTRFDASAIAKYFELRTGKRIE